MSRAEGGLLTRQTGYLKRSRRSLLWNALVARQMRLARWVVRGFACGGEGDGAVTSSRSVGDERQTGAKTMERGNVRLGEA